MRTLLWLWAVWWRVSVLFWAFLITGIGVRFVTWVSGVLLWSL